jgi:two-component system LytT family response regulator
MIAATPGRLTNPMAERHTDTLRAILVDDDPGARDALRCALERIPSIRVIADFADGHDAVQGIRELRPDVVFLDIELPGLDGIDVVEHVGPDRMPPVIFVTAWGRHAVKAFELHTIDYLLKPFEDAHILAAVGRARRAITLERDGDITARLRAVLRTLAATRSKEESEHSPWLRRFVVRDGDRYRFLPVADVDWIEAQRNYVRLNTGTTSFLLRGNLTRVLAELDPRRFARIHRSVAVNLDRVAAVEPEPGGDGTAVLRDGRRLRVSRTHRRRLLQALA